MIRGFAREDPLRASHPPKIGVHDGHGPAGRDLARHLALAQPLLEGVALVVAVKEARNWRVPPVHDLHAAAGLDVAALADEHVAPAAVLHHAQVPEIGRPAIDWNAFATTTLARQGLDSVHLFEQGPLIFWLRLGQGIPQFDERSRVVDRRVRPPRWRLELGEHDTEKCLLFDDDRRRADGFRRH